MPEVLFMLRSHNVSQQVRWRDGCLAKLGLLTMLEDIVTSFCCDRSANARGGGSSYGRGVGVFGGVHCARVSRDRDVNTCG